MAAAPWFCRHILRPRPTSRQAHLRGRCRRVPMTLSIPRLPPDALEEAECPRRDIADGEQRDYSHHRLLMRAHPHLYLTCGLRTHPGHPCPPPFPQLTQPRRSAIVSCAPTPTIPKSDHNKDAVIRPGTLRFPYAQTAERAPISCLFLGDRRLGEGRTISLTC